MEDLISSRTELALSSRGYGCHTVSALVVALALIGAARAQQSPIVNRGLDRTRGISVSTTPQTQKSCRTITYEGLQEKQAIPTFNGVSSTGWVAGISVAAYGYHLGDQGGLSHAQFINEPPPGVTVAVFLNGQNNDINFATPISAFQYYYATGYPTTLTAYDSKNNILFQHGVPANYSGNYPSGYDVWTQIPPVEVTGNQISRINILSAGPVLNNFLGIDNLTICTDVVIDSVELTQAIQQIQNLTDLQTTLSNTNEPPDPMISGRQTALRIYYKPVTDLAVVEIKLTIPGMPDQDKFALLQPNCNTDDQRRHNNQCPSSDFYFPAPAGAWDATLTVSDPNSGNVIEQELFSVKSRDTFALKLVAVSICDSLTPLQCEPADSMLGKQYVLDKIAPSNNVSLVTEPGTFFRPYSQFCPAGVNLNKCWPFLKKLSGDLALHWIQNNSATDNANKTKTVYVGVARTGLKLPGALANHIPGHSVVIQPVFGDFGGKVDDILESLAHEVGHTIGLRHTFSSNPPAQSPPGCSGFAYDPNTDWPWKMGAFTPAGDNRIQSLAGLEVGFDVNLKKPIIPDQTYEIMAYCLPQWIAPQRWKDAIRGLFGGAVTSPNLFLQPLAEAAVPKANPQQQYWMVSGTIPAAGGAVSFDPIFRTTTTVVPDTSSGAYSLELQDSTGTVLFTQNFDIDDTVFERSDEAPDLTFTQILPVTAGAASIVLKDPTSVPLGTISLGGVAPAVNIVTPTVAFTGQQPIHWIITDPDSSTFTSLVYYSPDNGANWHPIGQAYNGETTLYADFTTLPGTNGQGLVKVLVSDGVNMGQAISPAFSIAKKTPTTVLITSPTPNFTQASADPLILRGTAYDPDDGTLDGAALTWTSDIQGILGIGSQLAVSLNPGTHHITLRGTDSDNNSIATTTTVTMGQYPPLVNLGFNVLSAPPQTANTCLQATIDASPYNANGAPVSAAVYTLDGGASYTNVPVNQLPYTFVIPGTGFVDMKVAVTDASGQTNSSTASYFISFACGSITVPNVVGSSQAAAATTINAAKLVVGTTTQTANTVVPAGNVISQSPAAGSTIAPGSSDAVNLMVSSGAQVAVPNVVGQTQSAASAAITAAGLTVGTIANVPSTTVPAGSVISETPTAGTLANGQASVALTISTGTTLAIIAANLPAGTVNFVYPATALAGAGGTGVYTWSASGLPVGLVMDPGSGTISGVPTASKGSPFPVQITLTDSSTASVSQPFSLAIGRSCDLTFDGNTDVRDVQQAINDALGQLGGNDDLNQDGVITAADVQIVVNAILQLGCGAK